MTVVITGATKGLGKEIKYQLEEFYDVINISRSNGFDLSTIDGLEKAKDVIGEEKPTTLILNSGAWRNDFFLNYFSAKELSEKALEVNPKCHVIFILSNAAYQSYGNDDYTTSKSGLLHYARRKQRGGYKVSTISPGTIDTGFWEDAEEDNRKKGALSPKAVASIVVSVMEVGKNGGVVTELIILPEVKNAN